MSAWPVLSLGEAASPEKGAIISGPFGSNIGKRFFVDSGVPVIRGNNLADPDTRFKDEGFVYLSDAKARALNCWALPDDLIFTAAGSLGQVGLIPNDGQYPRYVISNKQLRIRLDQTKISPLFAYYYFSAPNMRAYVANQNKGSSVPLITLGVLRSLPIVQPPLPTQRKIAAILTAYDELIDNNKRRVKLVEEVARRIYHEWFADLRYPGHESVPLVASELGPIPQGWKLRPLFDVAEVAFGFPFKSELFNAETGIPLVRIRDLPNGQTATRTTETASGSNRVHDGDILIGMDGDFHMCRWSAGDAWLNQRVARLRPAIPDVSAYGLFLALEKPVADWNRAIVGTTVAHLGKRHLELIKIITPSRPIAARIANVLNPIFDLEIALRKATRCLRAARDLLLPNLISGAIDVTDLDIAMPPTAA